MPRTRELSEWVDGGEEGERRGAGTGAAVWSRLQCRADQVRCAPEGAGKLPHRATAQVDRVGRGSGGVRACRGEAYLGDDVRDGAGIECTQASDDGSSSGSVSVSPSSGPCAVTIGCWYAE